VEADSGGHTDGGRAYTLMPAMLDLRDRMMSRHAFPNRIRIGAAGGIGSPEAAAAALVLGADFLVTGSINQCTPEAGTSDTVKDLLAGLDVQDTAYAPAGDLFEMGARVQVVRKGTLFAARANKLQELYRRHSSLEDLDGKTRRTLEEKYFHRSLEEVWQETRAYLERHKPTELARAERNPKVKMARLFQWYFAHTTRAAREGVPQAAANYQVHCGPAMGAFNRFVAGSDLEPWRSRHVDVIAERLMEATARLLERRLRRIATPSPEPSAAPSAFPAVADQS
jgi:trans-AT polyketide synthase/acyltransferase/oxidoreductase domain-containing protein